jgi:hypothetical protein
VLVATSSGLGRLFAISAPFPNYKGGPVQWGGPFRPITMTVKILCLWFHQKACRRCLDTGGLGQCAGLLGRHKRSLRQVEDLLY